MNRAELEPEGTASQHSARRRWRLPVARGGELSPRVRDPRHVGRAVALPSQGRHMECETWRRECDMDGRGKSVPPAGRGTHSSCRPNDPAAVYSPRVRSARGTDLWDAGRTQQRYLPTHQPVRRHFGSTQSCTFSVHLVLCAWRFFH